MNIFVIERERYVKDVSNKLGGAYEVIEEYIEANSFNIGTDGTLMFFNGNPIVAYAAGQWQSVRLDNPVKEVKDES